MKKKISSESEPAGRRKCKSRKRWFTDFSESAKASRPLPCTGDAEAEPGSAPTLPSVGLVSSPLTCAKPVMERRGIVGFFQISGRNDFRLSILTGSRRLQFLLE